MKSIKNVRTGLYFCFFGQLAVFRRMDITVVVTVFNHFFLSVFARTRLPRLPLMNNDYCFVSGNDWNA